MCIFIVGLLVSRKPPSQNAAKSTIKHRWTGQYVVDKVALSIGDHPTGHSFKKCMYSIRSLSLDNVSWFVSQDGVADHLATSQEQLYAARSCVCMWCPMPAMLCLTEIGVGTGLTTRNQAVRRLFLFFRVMWDWCLVNTLHRPSFVQGEPCMACYQSNHTKAAQSINVSIKKLNCIIFIVLDT